MSKKQLGQAQKLGQKRTTWYVISEPAPAWVGEDETKLTRPILNLVMDLDADTVRQVEMTDSYPDGPELVKIVLDAILKPGGGARGKFRPTMIQTNETAVLTKLQPLTNIDIYCEKRSKPAQVTHMLRELEEHLMGRPQLPSLVSLPGVTEAMMADFYAAAAAYFEAAPWKDVEDNIPIAICCPPDAPPVYLVIMGNAEETFGLALYDDYDDLVTLYSGASAEMMPEGTRWVSVMYDLPHYLAFAELDAIEAHNWPIAARHAYPLFVAMLPGDDDVGLPTAEEIELATVALRAVPHFAQNYLDEDLEPMWDVGDVGYPPGADKPEFTLAWVDDEELSEAQVGGFMAQGQMLVADFIDGWEIAEEDYDEAMRLGAMLYSFMQLHRLHAEELEEEQLDYVEDVLWELGATVMDHANLPLDLTMFQGPPLFVEEYSEELGEDEADVQMYTMLWQNLGEYMTVVNEQMAAMQEEDEDEN